MCPGKLSYSATPCGDILDCLLRTGLRFAAFLALLAAVLNWPLQTLLVYLGVVALAGIAAGVEAWDRHRLCRFEAQTTVPVATFAHSCPQSPESVTSDPSGTDQPDSSGKDQ